MVQKATNSQTRLALITEVAENTTPATPAFTVFRALGEDLKVERDYQFSQELDGKRGQKNAVIASLKGSGGVDFEYSHGLLDTLLESALRNAWSTNVLTDANTLKSFTLETTYESGATDNYKRLTGAQVNTLSLDLKAADKVTGSASFMSRGADFATAIVAGATYVAGSTEPIQLGANFGSLTLGGSLTTDGLASLSMQINNNMRPIYALGTLGPVALGVDGLEIKGKMSLWVSDTEADWLRAYADGTTTGLNFILGTTTLKKIQFELPNIVLNDITVGSKSQSGDVMIECDWTALQASTLSQAVIRVTRNVV